MNLKDCMIILDPGHGKNTPGKCSPKMSDGTILYEWKWTREIADLIKERLDVEGIPCVLTVTNETDLGLSARAAVANKQAAKNKLLVSIHGNACTSDGKWQTKARGWEIWTTVGQTNSDILARKFIDNIKYCFGPSVKCRGMKEKNFTVIFKANCPAVLTENFFYDNEEDCKYMLSDEGKNAIADLHYRAIKEYLSTLK